MTIDAATLRRIAAMTSPEAMREALEFLAAQEEKVEHRKAGQRARTRRHRERDSGVTVTGTSRDGNVTSPPDGPPSSGLLPPLNPPADVPSAEKSPARKATPRDELVAVLDARRADAVLEHRQRIRKPLTAHGAALLAGKLRQAPDPNAAADMMVERGWQGFELGWLNGEHRGRGPPATGRDALTGYQKIMADEAGLFDGQSARNDDQ